jgi:hypothetical protein
MLSSGILDFAIGIVFTFLAVSLAAGAATEALSSIIKWRSRTLIKGVQDLLNDKDFTLLASQVYQHGLINPRGDGTNQPSWWARWRKSPAYIDSNHFAAALLDTLKNPPPPSDGAPAPAPAPALAPTPTPAPESPPAPAPGAAGAAAAAAILDLKNAVAGQLANNPQLKQMLDGIIERAEGNGSG